MGRQASIDEWLSVAGRVLGLVGLAAFGVKYMLTENAEPLLVSAAGLLYGLGKATQAGATLRDRGSQTPPADSTAPLGDTDAPSGAPEGAP